MKTKYLSVILTLFFVAILNSANAQCTTTVSVSSTSPLCFGFTGSAVAHASGGSLPYTYSWSNAATGQTVSGLLAGGYTVTVTNATGCTSTSTTNLTEPSAFSISASQISPADCGQFSGKANAAASGGTGSLTYSWSTGATGSTVGNLPSGTYTVTVFDANACSTTTNVTINSSPGPSIITNVINTILCYGSFGKITTSVTGGMAPYTYSWSNGSSMANQAALSANTYTVTVADANGCTSSSTASLTQPAAVIIDSMITSPVICGTTTGSITAYAKGGTGSLTYSWNTGGTGQTISGLSGGTYTVTVNDANVCTTTDKVNITVPIPISASASQITAATCGNNNGIAIVSASGGIGALTYNWNSGTTGMTANNLTASTYTVTVKDAIGCTITTSTSISNNGIPATPSICMVTVDSLSKHNIVIWEKTSYLDADSFIVYRETTSNTYKRIAAISKDSMSIFIDTVATKYFPFSGDPNSGTYRYKLQLRDTCGHYSQLSPYHNTIFVTQTGGTFNWNDYKIEGQTIPLSQLAAYYLYRDNIGNNKWMLVTGVSGSQLTANDPNYSSYPNGRWRIETQWSISCTPTLIKTSKDVNGIIQTTTTVNSSRSNIKNNIATGVLQNLGLINSIEVYPNPNNGSFTVSFENDKIEIINITVLDVMGKLIYSEKINTAEGKNISFIDLSNYSSGIYTLKIISTNNTINKKIVVQ